MDSGGASKVRVEDREYRSHGGKPLLVRVHRPHGGGPFPTLVDVHGGAWTSADRMQNGPIHAELAAAGIAVAALDFRMPPQGGYPHAPADVNFGIRWVKRNAAELGTRPAMVGGLGTSSGGHQIMLNALRPQRYATLPLPGGEGIDASLAFVVLGWPVLDPLARYRMAQARNNPRLLEAHHAYFPGEAEMIEGNPQLILERGEATHRPPVLILQGTDDDNLPDGMVDRFAADYRKAGGAVDLEKFAGQPHTFVTKDMRSEASRRAIELMKSFILAQPRERTQ